MRACSAELASAVSEPCISMLAPGLAQHHRAAVGATAVGSVTHVGAASVHAGPAQPATGEDLVGRAGTDEVEEDRRAPGRPRRSPSRVSNGGGGDEVVAVVLRHGHDHVAAVE